MRILPADDHALVRDAIKDLIERQIDQASVTAVGTFEEAATAVTSAEGNGVGPYDVVILDFRMPGMEGLSGLARMRTMTARSRIAIMSGLAGRKEVEEAMVAGADGFLPKTLPGPALSSAINLMASGERFVPSSTLDPDAAKGANGSCEPEHTLTRREHEVLEGLLKGSSNKEIARKLELQEVTIKLHVRSLCRKLEAKNRTHAVLRALEVGLA